MASTFSYSRRLHSSLAPPTIDRSNMVEVYQVKSNQTARLECPMYGTPKPRIRWLINSVELKKPHGKSDWPFQWRRSIVADAQIATSSSKRIERWSFIRHSWLIMHVSPVSGRTSPVNWPIISICKSSVRITDDWIVEMHVEPLVPPTIQRDPDQDHVHVIQHHHVALTCTAQGLRESVFDSRWSLFLLLAF